ncbi:MAG: ATP-dependent DNA helicase Rep [Gammaproteobacteria bacterium]|nr:MAG: ATP-dependent DNA helicase Rep [Gammaproteobacteria bacterium]
MRLNPKQQDAVSHIHGPLLVLAGAGSGKTSVITAKIVHLIRHCQYAAHEILAVTFTNKAAREMKARVQGALNAAEARGLNVSTFHHFGLQFLHQEIHQTHLRAGFSIFDEQDALNVIKELLPADLAADKVFTKYVQWQIGQWKGELIEPEEALKTALDQQTQEAARLYASYERVLAAYNGVDFDDLIRLPVKLLSNETIRARWQQRIRYLLVDEYQDTNVAQYRLMRHLVGQRAKFTVVGDDDQSIYAWRGANPENLAQLKRDFPNLEVITLEQNYRSTGRILKAANHLIANNPHLFEKKLWSEHEFGPPIRVVSMPNETAEADYVAAEIMRRRFNRTLNYGDVAILYRGNHQARIFEQALMNQQIPYRLTGGTSFFARKEIKDVLAYCRLLANPDDDNAFLRIINTPTRDIGPATLEALANHARATQQSLFAALSASEVPEGITQRRWQRLTEFRQMIDRIRAELNEHALEKCLKDLLAQVDYRHWLVENASNEKVATFRWQNVLDLIDWIDRLSCDDEGQARTLADIVQRLMLFDRLERLDSDEKQDQVQLMTLHAAKGLEFPVVYLVGCEEELLPHRTAIEEDTIEEERRLAYVGITRARQELILTMAQTRRRFGEVITCQPSRFLDELPPEDLQWENPHAKLSDNEQQQVNQANLAALRARLGRAKS